MKKKLYIFLLITGNIYAINENWYMGGQPYYNFGSSYYNNYGQNYYWGGDGWIFKTGYKAPTERCCRRVKCIRPCTWCRAYRKSLPIENNSCCNGVCQP
ncbi:MAG: hypothetical protein AMXMBFR12_00140 [Candidatus Babeliales bacterium]